jgi:hypothetical protein
MTQSALSLRFDHLIAERLPNLGNMTSKQILDSIEEIDEGMQWCVDTMKAEGFTSEDFGVELGRYFDSLAAEGQRTGIPQSGPLQ